MAAKQPVGRERKYRTADKSVNEFLWSIRMRCHCHSRSFHLFGLE
jgi:hypothetical protein